MRLDGITITEKDVQDILQQANPGQPASIKGDACEVYKANRATAMVGTSILSCIYPEAGAAVATMIAILNKACENESPKK